MENLDHDTSACDKIPDDLESYYKAIHENREKHPDHALISARKSLEAIVQVLITENRVALSPRTDLGEKMRKLYQRRRISENIYTQMNSLRLQVNRAAHHNSEPILKRDVSAALVLLSGIIEWFCMQHATLYEGRLIAVLERNAELERAYLDSPLLSELDAAKRKIHEAEAIADQSFIGGIAIGALGVIGALAGAKFLKKNGKGAPKHSPVVRSGRKTKPLTPEQKARLQALLRSRDRRSGPT